MSLLQSIGTWVFRIAGAIAPKLAGKAAYIAFCLPPRIPASDASRQRLTEKLGPLRDDAEARTLTTPDGTVQAYHWRTVTKPAKGRVLLVHGWTAEALVMGLFVKPLRNAGFDVVAIDLPAHGRSSGRMLNMPIGARAVLAAAETLGPFTGIITHSFGGAIAALAVEGGSPIYRKAAVDKLVLIASPHSISKAARDFGDGFAFTETLQLRLGDEVTKAARRPIETINIGDMLATVGRPVLVVHDTEDERVPFSEAEALVAGAKGHATLMQTKGLGHERVVVMPNVVRAAVRFLSGEPGR
jgi:pimeloyl-ACP methyl ester carboxylesterase